MKNLIKKDSFIQYIKPKFKNYNLPEDINFIVLNTYFHSEQGILLSGYLKSGMINKNSILNWYLNDVIKIKVLSISNVNSKVDKVRAPKLIVIKIKILSNDFTLNVKNLKYGFISNKDHQVISEIKIKWNLDLDNKKELICNSGNNKLILKLQDNNLYTSCNQFKLRNNLINNHLICFNLKTLGEIID